MNMHKTVTDPLIYAQMMYNCTLEVSEPKPNNYNKAVFTFDYTKYIRVP